MERIKDLDAWSKKAKAQWNAMMAKNPPPAPKKKDLFRTFTVQAQK